MSATTPSPTSSWSEIEKLKLEDKARDARARTLRPSPRMTVSEWADEYRILPPSSPEPGQFRTSRMEPMRGFQDAFAERGVADVVGVIASQCGKTEALNNVVGYYIDKRPSPMLFVQPTVELAEMWSKTRLAPMIRDTPALREIMGDATSRKAGQEILAKYFPGGDLAIAGANAPGGLAGRPRRVVLGDEVDRWPLSAGTEGSPVELARKRTTNYHDRVHGWISSPGNAGESAIWDLWEQSDQRRWWVPCPDCGEYQTLKWAQVWFDSEAAEFDRPETARYECEHCGSRWKEPDKNRAVALGEWRKTEGREQSTVAGFHLSAIASPWLTLEELVREWLQAQSDPEKLKVFVNTRLAELWEDASNDVDVDELLERREDWGEKVPDKVLVIVCGADVQDDRIELEIWGVGRGGESWSLDYRILDGDPADMLDADPRDPEANTALIDQLSRAFERQDGTPLRISATCIDSGGHFTDEVIRFATRNIRKRVFAIRGVPGEGKPLWPYRGRQARVKGARRYGAHNIGVDTGKGAHFHRLSVREPGPLYCHFPQLPQYDREYFEQLVGEAPEPVRYVRGRKQPRRWKQTHARVEALDCRNYAQAALASLSPNWDRLEANLEKARKARVDADQVDDVEELEADEVDEKPASGRRRAKPEPAKPDSIAERMERRLMNRRRRR